MSSGYLSVIGGPGRAVCPHMYSIPRRSSHHIPRISVKEVLFSSPGGSRMLEGNRRVLGRPVCAGSLCDTPSSLTTPVVAIILSHVADPSDFPQRNLGGWISMPRVYKRCTIRCIQELHVYSTWTDCTIQVWIWVSYCRSRL